jgi:hypothetical protein
MVFEKIKASFGSMNLEKIGINLMPLTLIIWLVVFFIQDKLPSWMNEKFFFVLFISSVVFFFAQKIRKIPEINRDKSPMVYYSSHFFLLSLVVIAVNQFLKNKWLIDNLFYISVLSIGFGFLTFYASRDRVEKEIEEEKISEEEAERKRAGEFDEKFPRVAKIWGLRRFVKWMYKEGWGYGVGLIAIVVLGFVLRAWNLNYLQGADNFNLISSLSYFQNGEFLYLRNPQITLLLGCLFHFFGKSLFVARLPFVIIGVISIYLTYILGRFVNKKIGLISAFLLAISPWAIELSSFVREYAELYFWNILFFIILYNVYLKEINNKKGYWRFVKYFMGISIFIILYAKITFNGTIKSSLFVIITASIYFSYNYIKRNYPRNMKYFILTLSMGFIFFFLIGHKIWTAMDSKLIFNPIWIGYLFNPQINIPMQWFSSLIAPPFFLISLFFIPLLFKGKEFKLFYLVFMSNLALFVFKYNGTYFHARYIYYFFFLYIIIFSGSFYYFFKIYSKKIKLQFFPRLLTILFCIFLFLFLFNNSFIAANHQNNVDYPRYDTNQPTFSGNRNYYFEIFQILETYNFSNNECILVEGEHPYYFVWEYGYNINRTFTMESGNTYEIGDKVYYISTGNGVNEFDLALKNKRGYAIIYHKETINMAQKKGLNKVDSYLHWEIYRWGDF